MVPLITLVDDDISVRRSLERQIKSVGMDVKTFASAEDFLNSEEGRKPECLILDVRLPGMSGIELHRHLLARGSTVPVIFITGHGSDAGARAQAASDWTVAYLIKPLGDELLDAINMALKLTADG
jgi:FixJ family two-component response regulator